MSLSLSLLCKHTCDYHILKLKSHHVRTMCTLKYTSLQMTPKYTSLGGHVKTLTLFEEYLI